jgi:hypothetical protein
VPSLVVDIHSLMWYTTADPKLSLKAKAALIARLNPGN